VPRPDLLTECRVLHDRLEIFRHLPPGGVLAEVGTMFGDYIVQLLDVYRPSEVHVFDYGLNNLRPQHKATLDTYGSVTFHVGDSLTKLSELPDHHFDVIYGDADLSPRWAFMM